MAKVTILTRSSYFGMQLGLQSEKLSHFIIQLWLMT